ncbi:hypothetical protein SAMN05421890_4904 [Ensifer adhaerens]|nr:hypothetical protein SAMN05421890_4904 [Ensifer adhaerens]
MAADTRPLNLDKEALNRQRERTRVIREAVASEVFGHENVSTVFSDAASKGRSVAFFEPSEPMDLSDTTVAAAAVKQFQETGFFAEWKTRQKPDGEQEKYLRVSWGVDAKPSPKA